MKHYKFKIVLIANLLSFILLLGIVLMQFPQNGFDFKESPVEKIRVIDANRMSNISFESKSEQLLSQFDDYNCDMDEANRKITFTGTKNFDATQLMPLNFVSGYKSAVTKTYETSIDIESGEFTL